MLLKKIIERCMICRCLLTNTFNTIYCHIKPLDFLLSRLSHAELSQHIWPDAQVCSKLLST